MNDQAPRSREVFLSYSSKDKEWAEAACAALERHGIRCWIAPRDIVPSAGWGAAIVGGIAACKIMVLILSAAANSSPHVRREVERAISKGIPVLPFRVEDVLPKDALEYALGNTHWLEGFGPPREKRLEELADAIEALIGVESPIEEDVPSPIGSPEQIEQEAAEVDDEERALLRHPRVQIGLATVAITAILIGLIYGATVKGLFNPNDSSITNTLGMKLKLIPAGEFDMGSDATDPDATMDEKTNGKKHHVRITKPFYLGTTEVTVGQFRRFVERSGYKTDAAESWRSPGFRQGDDHPVVKVSFQDAEALCAWLSKEESRTYRLPTEAEWEYACRAGGKGVYGSGDDAAELDRVAWYKKNSGGATQPVGQKPANPFGLHDMLGNAWEWCEDWFDADYYAKSPPTDPLNSARASDRVVRGGCWSSLPGYCRPADRVAGEPVIRGSDLGFRVAAVQ